MQLSVILAFVVLFWKGEWSSPKLLISRDETGLMLLAMVLAPALVGFGSLVLSVISKKWLMQGARSIESVHLFHHRWTGVLKALALFAWGGSVLFTGWPDWFSLQGTLPLLQIASDWVVLSPYLACLTFIWLSTWTLDGRLKAASFSYHGSGDVDAEGTVENCVETRRAPGSTLRYLDFQVRQQFLSVAVPVSVVLCSANVVRGHRAKLESWLGLAWGPDVIVGLVAALVFVLAPLMLRRIWRVRPLQTGPLRERLEALCARIGLRVRDILVWDSQGMMINAAVMGVIAPVRYVLLSDGLLAAMSLRQIEAVFGHEAGHVRHRHIQHLLIFALVGWLVVAAILELANVSGLTPSPGEEVPFGTVEGLGVLVALGFWSLGFGWISRRFERQADLFGARCIKPAPEECQFPCAAHGLPALTIKSHEPICATSARVFTSALDRVAHLNGIALEERSWRHPSIADRIRFLMEMASDQAAATDFEELLRRWKVIMSVVASAGVVLAGAYVWAYFG